MEQKKGKIHKMLQVSRSFASVHITYTGGTISCLPTNQLEIPKYTLRKNTPLVHLEMEIFTHFTLENPEIPAEITLYQIRCEISGGEPVVEPG